MTEMDMKILSEKVKMILQLMIYQFRDRPMR